MYRYELKCGDCGIIIGYVSLPYNPVDGNNVIDKSQTGNTIEPICCPVCEVRRQKNDLSIQ